MIKETHTVNHEINVSEKLMQKMQQTHQRKN